MTIEENQKLAELLSKYMVEQTAENEKNLKKMKDNKSKGKYFYSDDIVKGVKAKYNHARILLTHISVEIEKNIYAR